MTSPSSEKEYNVVVLDNDECIGAWSLASAIHGIFADYLPKHTGIPIQECLRVFKDCTVKYYLLNGGARPGTKETFKLLKHYKDTGVIDKVVMFTSCGNEKNWVICLKECLEQYTGVNGLYDLVLHRDNTEAKKSADGATIKNLDTVLVRLGFERGNTNIIMVDDRPHNIQGDCVKCVKVAVSPYRHVVDEKYISDMIDEMLDTLQTLYTLCKQIDGVKTFAPSLFRKMIKKMVLDDQGGRKDDVKKNILLNCPVNQLGDKSLIGQLATTFVNHLSLSPTPLVRSVSEHPVRLPLVRSISM